MTEQIHIEMTHKLETSHKENSGVKYGKDLCNYESKEGDKTVVIIFCNNKNAWKYPILFMVASKNKRNYFFLFNKQLNCLTIDCISLVVSLREYKVTIQTTKRKIINNINNQAQLMILYTTGHLRLRVFSLEVSFMCLLFLPFVLP